MTCRQLFRLCATLLVLFPAACLFLPNIQAAGYTACDSDEDCAAGRACEAGLCAPPPWHDPVFQERLLIVVDNPADQPLPAGTAIPVPVGGANGVFALADVRPDARYTDFDNTTRSWRVLPVFRDVFEDRFVVWIPTSRPIPAGGTDVLAWIEQDTADGTPTVEERPLEVFSLFDGFDGDILDPDQVFIDAPAAAPPLVQDGEVNVADNVKLVWRDGLVPPLTVTFRARINGTTCDEVFLGLTADDGPSFSAPSAGFFIDTDLATVGEVAPTADSVPTALSSPAPLDTAQRRYSITVDNDDVRFSVDGVVFDERQDLRPPFEPTRLLPTVEVGGTCSVDVDAVWMSPLPFVAPALRGEPVISLGFFGE